MSDVYEVDELCGHRLIRGKPFYWVKWKGYDCDQNTWESADNISPDLLEAYQKTMEESCIGRNERENSTSASKSKVKVTPKTQKANKRRSLPKNASASPKMPASSPGSTQTPHSSASRQTSKTSKGSRSVSPTTSKPIQIAHFAPENLSPAAVRPSSALAVLISKPVQDKRSSSLSGRRPKPKQKKPSALEDIQTATHDLRKEVVAMKDVARLRRQTKNNSPPQSRREEREADNSSSEDSTVSTEVQKPKKPSSTKKRRRRSNLSTPSRKKSRANDYFIVEKILNTRVVQGQQQFFVKWEGYPKSQSTWETEESFGANRHLIEEYFHSH